MKLALILLSISLTINHGTSELMRIVTADPYQWFPLRTNYLHFDVKAKAGVYVRLSAFPNTEQPFYKFIIGDANNALSVLRRDVESVDLVVQKGKFLNGKQYDSFSIIINEHEGSVSLVKGLNETLLHYKDPNFMKMNYFGIGTLDSVQGEWLFDFDAVFPSNCV